MNVNGKPYRTIWPAGDGWSVDIIDQTKFPHVFETVNLKTVEDAAVAIRDMLVRGAPLIGVTAAYGVALAMHRRTSDAALAKAYDTLVVDAPDRDQPQVGAGRDDARRCSPCAPRTGALRPIGARPRSPTRTSRSTRRSGGTASRSSRPLPRRRSRVSASTSSPTAMPAGSPPSTGAPPRPRSTRRMTRAFPSMSGWTRRGRAIRALP